MCGGGWVKGGWSAWDVGSRRREGVVQGRGGCREGGVQGDLGPGEGGSRVVQGGWVQESESNAGFFITVTLLPQA